MSQITASYHSAIAETSDSWNSRSKSYSVGISNAKRGRSNSTLSNSVRFSETAEVVLIPSREELQIYLSVMFWTESDYHDFKRDAILEIRELISRDRITPKDAIKYLYQPSYQNSLMFSNNTSKLIDMPSPLKSNQINSSKAFEGSMNNLVLTHSQRINLKKKKDNKNIQTSVSLQSTSFHSRKRSFSLEDSYPGSNYLIKNNYSDIIGYQPSYNNYHLYNNQLCYYFYSINAPSYAIDYIRNVKSRGI